MNEEEKAGSGTAAPTAGWRAASTPLERIEHTRTGTLGRELRTAEGGLCRLSGSRPPGRTHRVHGYRGPAIRVGPGAVDAALSSGEQAGF